MTTLMIDAPRPAIVQSDFLADAETPTIHNGKPYWITTCYEFVGGRWEGFVSMRRRSEAK